MKVLITGGKSAASLKLLKAFRDDTVVLADYGDIPKFLSGSYSFISLGEKNEDTIAHTLLNYCLNENVDAILPLHFFEIEPVAKANVLFEEFGIHVLLPDASELESYLDQSERTQDWSLFVEGKLLFTTVNNPDFAKSLPLKKLNGVFAHRMSNELSLLLI